MVAAELAQACAASRRPIRVKPQSWNDRIADALYVRGTALAPSSVSTGYLRRIAPQKTGMSGLTASGFDHKNAVAVTRARYQIVSPDALALSIGPAAPDDPRVVNPVHAIDALSGLRRSMARVARYNGDFATASTRMARGSKARHRTGGHS